MICEVCGRETDKLYRVLIDGAILGVCEICKSLGSPIDNKNKINNKKRITKEMIDEYEEELVENYNKIIRLARESMKLSQEEAAKLLGIKYSMYKSIEDGKIKPSIELAKKIEKKLNISIVKKVSLFEETGHKEPKLTIADIIEFEE